MRVIAALLWCWHFSANVVYFSIRTFKNYPKSKLLHLCFKRLDSWYILCLLISAQVVTQPSKIYAAMNLLGSIPVWLWPLISFRSIVSIYHTCAHSTSSVNVVTRCYKRPPTMDAASRATSILALAMHDTHGHHSKQTYNLPILVERYVTTLTSSTRVVTRL